MLAAVAAAGAARAAEPVRGTLDVARDFMIQNVCLDKAGAVLPRVSPIDGDPRCVGERDLRPGERLPYHKHDHSPPDDKAGAPRGYQRHDSVPVETAGLGTVVEHSFDFGAGEGRRFGAFDRPSDGGDIAVVSPKAISLAATEDAGSGFLLWVGECRGALTAEALGHAWIVALLEPGRTVPFAGETIARLNGVKAGRSATCPARFNAAYTRWSVKPVEYRAGPGQGPPIALPTLVSEHYGGARPGNADHLERFYFTRELGGTRWERWQNRNGNRDLSPAAIAEAASRFAATGRCGAAEPPSGGAPLVLVDCREWTRIVPAAVAAGDPPGFFIAGLREQGEAGALFAAPSGGK